MTSVERQPPTPLKPPETNDPGPRQAEADERQTRRQAPDEESPGVPASSDQ